MEEKQYIDLREFKKFFAESTSFYLRPQRTGDNKWRLVIYVTMVPRITSDEQDAVMKKIIQHFGEDLIGFDVIETGFQFCVLLGMSSRVPQWLNLDDYHKR